MKLFNPLDGYPLQLAAGQSEGLAISAAPKVTNCSPLARQMLANWNVEGLGAEYYKLEQIIFLMAQRNISILCMQETQCKGLHHFMQNGFLIILSGVAEESCGRANAGVGFIVAPWAIGSIIGFTLFSDRLSMLRVRVSGGT